MWDSSRVSFSSAVSCFYVLLMIKCSIFDSKCLNFEVILHIWTHRLCSRVLISLPSWNDQILLDQKDSRLPRQAVPFAHWLWHRLTDDPARVFSGLVPQRPSQILLHKKSTQPAEQRTNGCIPSMIWIAQLSTPLHIPCLWIIWWLPQSIRSMFYVFVFPCAVFVGLRKLQVVNRPRSGRVQAWPDDSSDAYMRLRGRARHRRTQRRRSARNTGRANPPVTSDGIQTPSGGTLNVRGSIMESSSIVPLFVFFL